MSRRTFARRDRCRDCEAYLQEGPTGPRCPWARGETARCGWSKGREIRDAGRPAVDYRGPTSAWR